MAELGLALGAGEIHDFPDADDRNQRGILQHCDELVAGRRDDDAHGLRQDDQHHRLRRSETERGRALRLTAIDALDAGAKNFRHVGAVTQRERENASRYGADHVTHLR
ncbi:hypothetical protein D3C86_1854880 [compost metagenome]